MPIPPAYMGFVGYVRFEDANAANGIGFVYPISATVVRATSADINLSQEITKPDVVDSRYDRTVYKLGPKIIEGGVSFPAVYGLTGTSNIVTGTYFLAAVRDNNSGLLSEFDLTVKYARSDAVNKSEFTYNTNIINTWQFRVEAEDVVNITLDLIGVSREPVATPIIPAADLTNTRIITWNDAVVVLAGGSLTQTIEGEYVRSFEANINNNANRYYTLNGVLEPQAIAPTKRDITGTVVLLGRHTALAENANDNQLRCSETNTIQFGYNSSIPDSEEGCQGAFLVTLPNCVFQIEEIALTNDLFESTINWHSLPAAGTGIADPLIDDVSYE